MLACKDFCPVCGTRFQGETALSIIDQILDHTRSGFCLDHKVPWQEAFGDTKYEFRLESKWLWPRKD